MDLVSRLDGFLNNEVNHNNPIPNLPPPKTVKDKKDTTLLDMALKALLKERMYGNLQNFHTQNIGNKNHLKIQIESIANQRKLRSSLDQSNIDQNLSVAKSSKNSSFFSIDKNQSNKFQRSEKISSKKRLSQISSSLDVYLKKTQERKQNLISEKRVRFADESLTKNLRRSVDQNPHVSFISSVQFLDTQKSIGFSNKQIQKEFKLPQIANKRKMKSYKPQNAKISKVLFKLNNLKINVKQDLWSFICNKKYPRIKKNKEATMLRNQSYHTSLDESINFSTGKKSVCIQSSIYEVGMETRRQLNKYNQNLIFSKENFVRFVGNEKLTLPSFISSIFEFFELSMKFPDKLTKSQFEQIFTSLYNQSDRAWCFVIFKYLDLNMNGKIDSSDLFKVYNIVDESKIVVQNYLNSLKIVGLKQNNEVMDSSQTKQKPKRQKTVVSQNGSSSHRSMEKKSTKVSLQGSIRQKVFNTQQNPQIQMNLIKNNIENLMQFQKQIQILNQNILSKNSTLSNQKLSENPQSNSTNKDQKVSQKLYLQQGLLSKKDVKISELGSILQQVSNENSTQKKKVLDIDRKKLNIKLSSAYVKTFIATNHNQETRMNRELLDNLKEKVKSMSENKSSSYRSNILSGIQYAQFYEQKFFVAFKSIFFAFLQIIIQIN